MAKLELKVIRFDESNKNEEALKGKYGQYSDGKAVFTLIKNILFINLLPGAKYDNLQLPIVYDGFIQLSNGGRIQVKNSILTCNLDNNTNGFGQLVLKVWN